MPGPTCIRVHLSFGKSHSVYYADAVEIARTLPGYQQTGEGKDVRHSVSVALDLLDAGIWDALHKLHQITSRWGSYRVSLEGTPIQSLHDFMTIARGIQACWESRQSSDLGESYCSERKAPDADAEAFGCRRIRGISRAITPYSHAEFSWWQFGRLLDLRSFLVDKQGIMAMLRRRADGRVFILCPAFSWERVQRDVEDLPDRLHLNKDSRFELRYSEINPSQALGVKPRFASLGQPLISQDVVAETEAGLWEETEMPEDPVWVAPLAMAFHTEDCALCGAPRWPVSREAALERGLIPCPVCQP